MPYRHSYPHTRTALIAMAATVTLALTLVAPRPANAGWPTDPAVNRDVCVADDNQQFPSVLPDGAGGVFVAWQDYRDLSHEAVYAQRLSASGVPLWGSNGIRVCPGSFGDQLVPHLASDGAGGVIVTWNDTRALLSDIYCQRVSAAGALLWGASGVALCTAGGPQHDESVVPDGSGGAIVAWWDRRDNAAAVIGDIYAQRVSSSGIPLWAADGVPICTAANSQQYPMIVSDGAGGGVITWTDGRSVGTGMDIYAQRVNASGTRLWTANGVVLCSAANDQTSTVVVTDGAGGAIVAWSDARSAERIYAQRVSSAGAPQWTANGVALSSGMGETLPAMVSDGAGGAILSWVDFGHFPTSQADIRAQRVSSAGSPQWTAGGVTVCDFVGYQFVPIMTTDGSGGAIVAWTDYRDDGSNGDVYARRLTSAGVAQWSAATKGTAVTTAVGAQTMPVIAAAASGGAILAWQDDRDGNSDIYAQRVDADGSLGTSNVSVAPSPASGLALSLAGENPARARQVLLRFSLAAGGPATLELIDVSGRRVRERALEGAAGGTNVVDLAVGEGLAPGLYLARLRQGSQVRTVRVAVLGAR